MPSRKLNDAHPVLQEAYKYAKTAFEALYPNLEVILTCTYRSHEEQQKLYNYPHDGLDNNNNGKIDEPSERVTKAKPGQSKHNYYPSKAIDVAFLIRGESRINWDQVLYKQFANLIRAFNNQIRWGGDFKFVDAVHFEIS